MKDIFDYMHDHAAEIDHIQKIDLTASEKDDVLNYIRLKQQSGEDASETEENVSKIRSAEQMNNKRRNLIAAAAAAVILVGGTAYAAINWNRGIVETLQVTDEQKKQLETTDLVATVGQSCTQGDITITVDQCITDNYGTYISFNVKGYQLEEGKEPGFEEVSVVVDDMDDVSYSAGGSFYDGIVIGADGRGVYADGTKIDWDSDADPSRYVADDGSLQYMYVIACGEKGKMIGKDVHVKLRNLGSVSKAEYTTENDGTGVWEFDWTLQGSSASREVQLNEQLGDTGAKVISAEISPISLLALFEFPRQEYQEICYNEEQETEWMTAYKEPPALSGVCLKDGTLLPYLDGGPGMSGYTDEEGDTYMTRFVADRLLDVDQVDALLFFKTMPESGMEPTEDNFYIVPIK